MVQRSGLADITMLHSLASIEHHVASRTQPSVSQVNKKHGRNELRPLDLLILVKDALTANLVGMNEFIRIPLLNMLRAYVLIQSVQLLDMGKSFLFELVGVVWIEMAGQIYHHFELFIKFFYLRVKLLNCGDCDGLAWVYYEVVGRDWAGNGVNVEYSPLFERASINELVNCLCSKLATSSKNK